MRERTFWRKVDKTDTCWLWTGHRTAGGYGFQGSRMAHRISYEMFVGPIPDGYQVDHLCRVHPCVNPDHLEAVTPAENARRTRREFCASGHALEAPNLYHNKNGRSCKTCARAFNRASYYRRKEVAS